jgi:hypothetical protein
MPPLMIIGILVLGLLTGWVWLMVANMYYERKFTQWRRELDTRLETQLQAQRMVPCAFCHSDAHTTLEHVRYGQRGLDASGVPPQWVERPAWDASRRGDSGACG